LSENWLQTVGKCLATPFKKIMAPWWERLVEKKAEDAAFRIRLLTAIVQFRVNDFARSQDLDSDKRIGIAAKISNLLSNNFDASNLDVLSQEFLSLVETEVHVFGVLESTWLQIACLAAINEFNPQHFISIEFTDAKGSRSSARTYISSLQSSFPFWQLLHLNNPENANLSPEALQGLSIYTLRNNIPEVKYYISPEMPPMEQPLGDGMEVLPRAWRPSTNV